MSRISRRIAAAACGAVIATSALAATGSAAEAAKPSDPQTTTQPLTITTDAEYFVGGLTVYYSAPVTVGEVQSATCALDSVPWNLCGGLVGAPLLKDPANYVSAYPLDLFTAGEHTITYTVTTNQVTYVGSVQVTGTGS